MLNSVVAFLSLIKKLTCLQNRFSYCIVVLLGVMLPYVCVTVVKLLVDSILA